MTPARRLLLVTALVVLPALAACGGGEQDAAPEAAGGGGEVTAEGAPDAQTATVVGNTELQFVPSTVRAQPGSLALTLTIEGGVPHNLVFRDESVGADIDTFSEGSRTGTFRFPAAGSFDFTCTLHPGMDGAVVVA